MSVLNAIITVGVFSVIIAIMNGEFDGNTSAKIELKRADYYCAEKVTEFKTEVKTFGKTMHEELVKKEHCAVYKLKPQQSRGF